MLKAFSLLTHKVNKKTSIQAKINIIFSPMLMFLPIMHGKSRKTM